MHVDLTIIILHYNTPDLVGKALESLEKFHFARTQLNSQVIVVDNKSSTDNLKRLKNMVKNYTWARVMENKKNSGFAAGNNTAIRQSLQENSRYVMLLNSDTECTTETNIDAMVCYADHQPKVAVMTPKLLLNNGKVDLASHRGEPTPWASFTYFSGLENLLPEFHLFSGYHQLYKNLAKTHLIDACSGAAMLVKATIIEKIGLLDERFFMYAEDLDWCKRFRDAGHTIVYFPESVIIHHKYQSGRKQGDRALAKKTSHHFYDTMLQYYDKHYRDAYPEFVRWSLLVIIRLKKGAS
jgi:GT2 family glycosyltransferase